MAKSAGLKNLLCVPPLAEWKKLKINFVYCVLRAPNRRLLSRKTEFEFVRPFDLIPKHRAFCEARPAESGASEQPNASEFSKCLNWSEHWESNPVYANPNRAYYRYTMLRFLKLVKQVYIQKKIISSKNLKCQN